MNSVMSFRCIIAIHFLSLVLLSRERISKYSLLIIQQRIIFAEDYSAKIWIILYVWSLCVGKNLLTVRKSNDNQYSLLRCWNGDGANYSVRVESV